MRKIGMIFGVSHVSSAYFYKNLIQRFKQERDIQPEFIVYNIGFSVDQEEQYVKGEKGLREFYKYKMEEAIDFFTKNQVLDIAMPCFSLTPVLFEIGSNYGINILNPFKRLPRNGLIYFLSINNEISYFNGIVTLDIHNEIHDKIRRIVNEIINGASPHIFSKDLLEIEENLITAGVENYCLGCSEICLVDYESNPEKIHRYNLLDLLTEQVLQIY